MGITLSDSKNLEVDMLGKEKVTVICALWPNFSKAIDEKLREGKTLLWIHLSEGIPE